MSERGGSAALSLGRLIGMQTMEKVDDIGQEISRKVLYNLLRPFQEAKTEACLT